MGFILSMIENIGQLLNHHAQFYCPENNTGLNRHYLVFAQI